MTTQDRFENEFGIHFSPSELQFAKAFIEEEIARAVAEREREIVEWVEKNVEDFYPDEHGINGTFVDVDDLITYLTT